RLPEKAFLVFTSPSENPESFRSLDSPRYRRGHLAEVGQLLCGTLDPMTFRGHLEVMKLREQVGIAELKAHLGAYLRKVRAGHTVTLLDRQTPVAQLVPIEGSAAGLRIRPASRSLSELEFPSPVKPAESLADLLAERRNDR
ncbi:MAG: type II toxin-antitoxin system Phd/YefM family antitoxin, partial [Myxococcales bacterium]